MSAACASTLRCPAYLLTNAVMAHPIDVTKYYKCHESRYLMELKCDPGMEFDSHRKVSIGLIFLLLDCETSTVISVLSREFTDRLS